jgi:hypothetical protein
MKKLFATMLVVLALASCEYSNEYGECVGLDDEKSEALEYDVSTRNVILGLMGSELFLIPPAIVALDAFYCPVGLTSQK